MSRLDALVEQIRLARDYTEELLKTVGPDEWFRMPSQGVTHVSWQVGHLAVAEYRLALERIRGPRDDDTELLSEQFVSSFGIASVPALATTSPSAEAIRAVFDRVHQRVLDELAELPDSALDEPPALPHRRAATKADVLAWCARHEMLHAGQIGLLRRLLGHAPFR